MVDNIHFHGQVQTMKMKWRLWAILFFFLPRRIIQETWTAMDIKIANIIVKNKSTPIFHGLFFYRP